MENLGRRGSGGEEARSNLILELRLKEGEEDEKEKREEREDERAEKVNLRLVSLLRSHVKPFKQHKSHPSSSPSLMRHSQA
jgi:hypothetical protein